MTCCDTVLQATTLRELRTEELEQVLHFVKTGPDAQQVLVLGQAAEDSVLVLGETELGSQLVCTTVLRLVRRLSRLLAIPTKPS